MPGNKKDTFCKWCGTEITGDRMFCPECGKAVRKETVSDSVLGHINKSGCAVILSIISTFLTWIIRLCANQEKVWPEFGDKHVLAVYDVSKPYLMIIPIIAAYIASILVIKDSDTDKANKAIAFLTIAFAFAISIGLIYMKIPA